MVCLRYVCEYLEWIMDNWKNVFFIDECKVKFFSVDRGVCVWRREGECFFEFCIYGIDCFGGFSVMIWGGISLYVKIEFVILNEGIVIVFSYIE